LIDAIFSRHAAAIYLMMIDYADLPPCRLMPLSSSAAAADYYASSTY